MAVTEKRYKMPALWAHPHVLLRRILRSWPAFIWLLCIVGVFYLHQSAAKLSGMAAIVDTTAQPVAPLETARLATIHVVLGQRVNSGAVVASMDTSLVDAQLAQLDAEMFEAESSIGNFERSALSTIKNFEDAINSATASIADLIRRKESASAQLQQLETEQARLDQLFAKKLIDATQANASRPQIAALRNEVNSSPEQISVAEKRLKDALRGQDDLRDSLRLGKGEDIKDAISRRAEAQRKIFDANRNSATIRLRNYTLTATQDAIVSRIMHQPGDVISAGDPIMRLVAAHPTQVIGFLPEVHLAGLKEGASVYVSRPSGIVQPIAATVISIAPEVDTLPAMVSPILGQPLRGRRVIVRLDGPHDLIPGEGVRIDNPTANMITSLLRKLIARGEAPAHD